MSIDVMAYDMVKDFEIFRPARNVDTLEKPRYSDSWPLLTDQPRSLQMLAGEIGENDLKDLVGKLNILSGTGRRCWRVRSHSSLVSSSSGIDQEVWLLFMMSSLCLWPTLAFKPKFISVSATTFIVNIQLWSRSSRILTKIWYQTKIE